MICYKEGILSFCTLYGVWGDDFHKKFQILEFFFSFCFISFIFLNIIAARYTLKGSRSIQGFALIRAVLFYLEKNSKKTPANTKTRKIQGFQIIKFSAVVVVIHSLDFSRSNTYINFCFVLLIKTNSYGLICFQMRNIYKNSRWSRMEQTKLTV